MVEIACVLDARASLGEGTLWDGAARVLWWIDIWDSLILLKMINRGLQP